MTILEGPFIKNCPKCYKHIGIWENSIIHGHGKCYNKSDKLIYEGRFENSKPVEKYPNRK